MTKARRRQSGEGGISEYATKAGPRYLIKYRALLEDGTSKVVLRRGYPTRKAAAEALGDINAEVRKGTHVVATKVTLGEWLDQWLDGLQLAPSTAASYRKNVRLHIKPRLGGVQLRALTGARISTVYRELEVSGRQDHKGGTGLAPRTVRYVHTILKAALRDAVDQGLIATNPADKAKPPSARSAKAPDIHPWTGPQLRAFLDWAKGNTPTEAGPRGRGRPQARAPFEAYHLAAYTGMRRGELLALRWRDLDLEHSRLSIRRAVGVVKAKGEGERLVEGPTKSTRARVIDLDPGTIDVLRQWRLDRAGLSLKLVRDDALIFATIEGDYMHPERFSRTFVEKQAQCRKATGVVLPAIHLHDLRHTHATLLLQAGEPVKVVSERLGHASVMITLEIYAHVMPGMQAQAAARFAAIIGGTA